jgi:hypothetical protein
MSCKAFTLLCNKHCQTQEEANEVGGQCCIYCFNGKNPNGCPECDLEEVGEVKDLTIFKGNKLTEREKCFRVKELKKLIEENEIDSEMIPYLSRINDIDSVVTTQCCYGHNGDNNRKAHIDFRCSYDIETLIDKVLRPLEDKFGCNIQILTEQNRLRYCIWMDNNNWQDQLEYLIELLKDLNNLMNFF